MTNKSIQAFLSEPKTQNQIAKALPRHMNPDRMARVALTECRKNPELLKCDPVTLFGAFLQCAQLGLEPGSGLGHAYVIPFQNRKLGTIDVQLIIGYRGMVDLARRSGQIVSLQAHAVYEKDKFEFSYGLNEKLEHVPYSKQDRGQLVAVYAVAKLVGGGYQIEVLQRHEIDAVRSKSKTGKYGPWNDHYEEMAKKTAIRRLFKYLPVSVEIQQAAKLDEMGDSDTPQELNTWIETEYESINEDQPKSIENQQPDWDSLQTNTNEMQKAEAIKDKIASKVEHKKAKGE